MRMNKKYYGTELVLQSFPYITCSFQYILFFTVIKLSQYDFYDNFKRFSYIIYFTSRIPDFLYSLLKLSKTLWDTRQNLIPSVFSCTVRFCTVREDMKHILLKDWKYGAHARTYVGRYECYIDLKEIKVPLSFRVFESFESFMEKLSSFF